MVRATWVEPSEGSLAVPSDVFRAVGNYAEKGFYIHSSSVLVVLSGEQAKGYRWEGVKAPVGASVIDFYGITSEHNHRWKRSVMVLDMAGDSSQSALYIGCPVDSEGRIMSPADAAKLNVSVFDRERRMDGIVARELSGPLGGIRPYQGVPFGFLKKHGIPPLLEDVNGFNGAVTERRKQASLYSYTAQKKSIPMGCVPRVVDVLDNRGVHGIRVHVLFEGVDGLVNALHLKESTVMAEIKVVRGGEGRSIAYDRRTGMTDSVRSRGSEEE